MTLTIHQNPGGGTLHGVNAVTAVNGVAIFTDLFIDQPGIGYTLDADGPAPQFLDGVQPAVDLPTVESDPFDVTQPGPPPVSCDTVYGVTDTKSNSRFFSVDALSPYTLTPLGGVHQGTNFEGIEVNPRDLGLYAATAASNRHGMKGFIYRVDPLTGASPRCSRQASTMSRG